MWPKCYIETELETIEVIFRKKLCKFSTFYGTHNKKNGEFLNLLEFCKKYSQKKYSKIFTKSEKFYRKVREI